MITLGKFVATEPQKTRELTSKKMEGLSLLDYGNALVELKVVYPALDKENIGWLEPGDSVFIKGERNQYLDEVYTDSNGIKFVLVPTEFIIGYKNSPADLSDIPF